ncbi:MAG: BON domain-containing protein [Candidatus Binatia bacterium]
MRRIHKPLMPVVVAIVAALAWPALADDNHKSENLPVVEATIPETLHPHDFALMLADRAIASRVRATLVAAPFLSVDADAIAVQVRNGEVTLLGFVRSQELIQEVSLRVPLIPGVTDLDNRLTIKSGSGHKR